MTIAYDANTEFSRAGGGGASHSFLHTPSGTPRGVCIPTVEYGTGDNIASITYGGVALTRVQTNTDTVTEPGRSSLWFVGSGIPTGAQTVFITLTSDVAFEVWGTCVTLTAATDTELVDADGVDNDADDPSVVMSYGGRTCITINVLYSGQANPTQNTELGTATLLREDDNAATTGFASRQTTPGTTDYTSGVTTGALDDVAFSSAAFSEVAAGAGTNTTSVTRSVALTANARYFAYTLSGSASNAPKPVVTSSNVTWTEMGDQPFADQPGTATRRLTAFAGEVVPGTGGGSAGLSHPWAGTWVIRQLTSSGGRTGFATLAAATADINAFLDVPGCVGFSPRIPWDEVETSAGVYTTAFLDSCRALATAKGKLFIPRFIAGQYTPTYIKTAGGTVSVGGVTIPRPFTSSGGAANTDFDDSYEDLLATIVAWASGKSNVVGIHCAWHSYQYSELYYGPEIQSLFSGNANTNKPNYIAACKRLIDRAFAVSTAAFPVAFGLSGHGPIQGVTDQLSTYMRTISQQDFSPRILMNANGWGPGGEWGGALEATHDADVWPKLVLRGLQDIHPANGGDRSATNWDTMFDNAENLAGRKATWVELYADQIDDFQDSATALARMKARMLTFYQGHQTGTGTPGTVDVTATVNPAATVLHLGVISVTGADLSNDPILLSQDLRNTTSTTAALSGAASANSIVVNGFGRNSIADVTWTNATSAQTTEVTSPATQLDIATGTGTAVPSISWAGAAKWGGINIEVPTATTDPPDPDPQPVRLTTPFIPLATQMDGGAGTPVAQLNGMSDAALETLCSYYKHFHDEGANQMQMSVARGTGTLASAIVANGSVVSKYKNSYCQQGSFWGNDAQIAEASGSGRDIILWFWPGRWGGPRDDTANAVRWHRVRNDINASVTSFSVFVRDTAGLTNAPSNPSPLSSGSSNPSYNAGRWPYWTSKGTGTTSPNTAGAKSFIRVDNEVMRVTGVVVQSNQNLLTLTVVRGALGTTAASHLADTRYFAPVYVGAVENNQSPDASLAGNPALNGSGVVRYCVDFQTNTGADFLADRAEDAYGESLSPKWRGYNALWWDVSGNFMYNLADAWQNKVIPWDDVSDGPFTPTLWAGAQVAKFTRFGTRAWTDENDEPVFLYANGMASNRALWVSSGMPTVTDAGIFEKHPEPFNDSSAQDGTGSTFVTDLFDVMVNDREAILWARPERQPAWDNRTSGMRWVYCLILQAYRTTAHHWQLMSKFDLSPGLVAGNGGAQKPDYIFFWNIGTPVSNPTALATNLVSTGLYAREFTNGIALVNFNATASTYTLPAGTWYDTTAATETVDPVAITGSISVPAHDGRIVLRSTQISNQQQEIIVGFTDTHQMGVPQFNGPGITVGFTDTHQMGFPALQIVPSQSLSPTPIVHTTQMGTPVFSTQDDDNDGGPVTDPLIGTTSTFNPMADAERLGKIQRR